MVLLLSPITEPYYLNVCFPSTYLQFSFHNVTTAVTLTRFWGMSSHKSCIKVIAHNSVVFKSGLCESVKPLVSTCGYCLIFHTIVKWALYHDNLWFLISSCDSLPAQLSLKKNCFYPYQSIHPECCASSLVSQLFCLNLGGRLRYIFSLPLCLWDASTLSFVKCKV